MIVKLVLTLYLIEAPFNAYANRADQDQAAPYGNMIYLILTSNFYVLCTTLKVYLYNYS